MSNYGRERIVLVEIDQPLCSRVYGDGLASPTPASGCQASLSTSNPRKCFNSRATCQDPDNYDAGTLTLRFGRRQHELSRYYGLVIPSLVSLSTTPGSLNIAAMYDSAKALGQREVVSLVFDDHRHSDLLVDKYRLERLTGAAAFGSPTTTYNPATRGTFWGKWLARNPYHQGYALRVYDGFLGDDIEDMDVRHYIIDRIEGPSEGQIKMVAKDTFAKIESKKAVAPPASRGELGSNITAVSTTAALSPAGIGDTDYPNMAGSPSEFYVAIGDELIKCSRADGSDTLNLIQRGALGTTAAAHNDEDLVQWVLVYDSQLAHEIVQALLINYAGFEAADFASDWDTQAVEITNLYTGRIAEPTPVQDLVGELCQQAGFTVWPDPATGTLKLRALRASTSIATVTDDEWIIDGSLSLKRQDDKRVSQVWVYYGQKNPLNGLTERNNYYSRVVSIDPDAETAEQYGTARVQEVFSRWIPQFGRSAAVEAGDRILSIFRDPPIEARFAVDAGRDGELRLAEFFTLATADVQDATGDVEDGAQYAAVSIRRDETRIAIVAQEIAFALIQGTSSETDPRTIYIENDTDNLDLRAIHDSLYGAPPTGSPGLVVTFVVVSGVIVGSASTSEPAIRTGSWSIDSLRLINHGRIEGKGGAGGRGHDEFGSVGDAGGDGGDALFAEAYITVDNTDGEIWGGGGGGGGGGFAAGPGFSCHGGGGGGGGAGLGAGGGGGSAGDGLNGAQPGQAGASGTSPSGGLGGPGGSNGDGTGGAGGTGGGPGLAGDPGTGALAGIIFAFADTTFGTGGARGDYIVGNSKVTWLAVGDVRGGAS